MVQYFKKTRMYKIAKKFISDHFDDVLDIECLKNCFYTNYRGSEWLTVHFDNFDYELRIYNCSSFIRFEVYKYSVSQFDYICDFSAFLTSFERSDFIEQIPNF